MICHVTIGNEHLVLQDPQAGTAAHRSLRDTADCPSCGRDLAHEGVVARPSRRDARAGKRLRCRCGQSWPIVPGDPLEACE